jgi:hypothetical protein
MVMKTFPNVVGCDLDRATTLIDTFLRGINVSYSLKSVPYNRIKIDQRKNEIILYLDKFNEVISTPYILYDESYAVNKIVLDEEEEDDSYL